MFVYLTKVIVIAGFYTGCTGIVMGHNDNKDYFLELTCLDQFNNEVHKSSWVEAKEIRKAGKGQ